MEYTQIDISALSEDERKEILDFSLHKTYYSVLQTMKEVTAFTAITLGMITITDDFFKSDRKFYLREEEQIELKSGIMEMFFEEGNKYYHNSIQNSFISYHHAFEVFIGNIYRNIFWVFPEFLNQKMHIDIQELFLSQNILEVRTKLIENKVKDLIQSNNIKQIVFKLREIFGLEVNITKEDLDFLFVSSNTRNLLIHNGGIVNNIFLQSLHANKIRTEYKLGDKIVISESELRTHNEFYLRIFKVIFESVKNQIERVSKYASSKSYV